MILIVDDEPDILDTLREAFEYDGYTVITASDGAPCAAILDLLMPVMDGGALYTAMKSDPRLSKTVVIFCTSAPAQAPRGAIVMAKPIDLTKLVALVHAHC
jgi:CheY-like chemotaxis protein